MVSSGPSDRGHGDHVGFFDPPPPALQLGWFCLSLEGDGFSTHTMPLACNVESLNISWTLERTEHACPPAFTTPLSNGKIEGYTESVPDVLIDVCVG